MILRTPTNPFEKRTPGEWFQFTVPATLMAAMFAPFLPSVFVCGIAVVCAAANGYVITRNPALLRQIFGVTLLTAGTAFSLYLALPMAAEWQGELSTAIVAMVVIGLVISFMSTVWHFATGPEANPGGNQAEKAM
jgi:hypothetical protein